MHVLQVNTVAPVLYASQWFLTLFACPFPSAFSARVIDIILAEGNSEILLQVCLPTLSSRAFHTFSKDCQGQNGDVLRSCSCGDLQTALAVVAQCETELLQLDDFEDIITHLKVRSTLARHISPQLLHTKLDSPICTGQMQPLYGHGPYLLCSAVMHARDEQ
jgi:Rab-GTPase-TBC domain